MRDSATVEDSNKAFSQGHSDAGCAVRNTVAAKSAGKTDELRLNTELIQSPSPGAVPLVLLHGWASNREIWRPLIPYLRPFADITLIDLPGLTSASSDAVDTSTADLEATELANLEPAKLSSAELTVDQLIAAILRASPARAVYLGWSLGGQIAALLAQQVPHRVKALVTVCSNPSFCANKQWPGMSEANFSDFSHRAGKNLAKTIKRFDLLQSRGVATAKAQGLTLDAMRSNSQLDSSALLAQLQWLGQMDSRNALQSLTLPQLHLTAVDDSLLPASVHTALVELLKNNKNARLRQLPGSHLAPLEIPAQLAEALAQFLHQQNLIAADALAISLPSKESIASSFGRAASRYDSVAELQRKVADALIAELPEKALPSNTAITSNTAINCMVDLGCGTGYAHSQLRSYYPTAHYIGVDLAAAMVGEARSRVSGDPASWLVGDAESLPLGNGSADLIFSSLAIQWCGQLPQLFAEVARVLRRGGRFLFSTLAPGTLGELQQAWAMADADQHVNQFASPAQLQAAASGLEVSLKLRSADYPMFYDRVGELTRELKILGAHNMNERPARGLAGRKNLHSMTRAYERHRQEGKLPATYKVLFGELRKQ